MQSKFIIFVLFIVALILILLKRCEGIFSGSGNDSDDKGDSKSSKKSSAGKPSLILLPAFSPSTNPPPTQQKSTFTEIVETITGKEKVSVRNDKIIDSSGKEVSFDLFRNVLSTNKDAYDVTIFVNSMSVGFYEKVTKFLKQNGIFFREDFVHDNVRKIRFST